MWRIGLFLLDACLKGLHLVVDEVARGNLPPASNELKDGVEGREEMAMAQMTGGAMRAGHAVY